MDYLFSSHWDVQTAKDVLQKFWYKCTNLNFMLSTSHMPHVHEHMRTCVHGTHTQICKLQRIYYLSSWFQYTTYSKFIAYQMNDLNFRLALSLFTHFYAYFTLLPPTLLLSLSLSYTHTHTPMHTHVKIDQALCFSFTHTPMHTHVEIFRALRFSFSNGVLFIYILGCRAQWSESSCSCSHKHSLFPGSGEKNLIL